MPNVCVGYLTFECSTTVFEQIKNYVQGDDSIFDFEKIIPMPDDIYMGSVGPEERKIYGEKNWYDWSCKNWGTKWNAMEAELEGTTYRLETAWSPCSPVIAVLAKRFPEATMRYSYSESGLGFCGVEEYQNGVLTYSLYGDYKAYYYDEANEPDYLIPAEILECPDVSCVNEKFIPGAMEKDLKTGKLYFHAHIDDNSGFEIIADVSYVGNQPSCWWYITDVSYEGDHPTCWW